MATLRESYLDKGMTLAPAGIWERDEDTQKKKPIVAYRADGLDFANFPKDNIAKVRIEEIKAPADMRVLIIDADSQQGLDTAYKLFPQCKYTFSHQTSQPFKRHFFFYVSSEKFEEFRAVGALEDIDILTYGILFVAHFFREAEYNLPDFKLPILELDEKSCDIILASLDEKNTSYGMGEHSSFVNKEMANLVTAYTKDKLDISGADTASKTNRNNLFKQITPKALKNKGQRKFEAPDLSHDTLNTMALLVAKNSKIPNETAIKFIEKLLVDVYGVSLNSELTQVHWYKSILCTLPFFESLFNPMEDFREFDEIVIENSTDNSKDRNFKWVLFGTTKNGASKFMQINKFTYKLRSINGVTLFDENYIRKWYPHLAQDDIAEIPQLAITANPYEDIVIFDEENDVFTLNTLHPSPYKLGAVANKTKPDNVLTQMIALFFGNELHEEFYYHWLAHLMYGNKPVNVVMWFCSDSNAEAGTGKTLLSASLPAQLIGFDQATTVDSSVASAGWGQIYETKLLSYNDLNKMKDTEWDNLYAKIKDEATNSTSKLRNNKGGDIMKSLLGVCQSGSSNFIPKVDSSDRRFFIVSPKEKLDQVGADMLHHIFEEARSEEHKEVQEIADYLAHIYSDSKDKFKTELYTRALMTAEKTASSQMGAYTHTIIPRIQHNPRELFDIFKEATEFTSEWQDWQIITFIKMQTHDSKVYLPHNFLNYLINRVKGADESRGIAQIMSTLQMKKEKLGASHQGFKDIELVRELGLPTEIVDYTTYGVITEINEDAYKKYMPKKIVAKGIQRLNDD